MVYLLNTQFLLSILLICLHKSKKASYTTTTSLNNRLKHIIKESITLHRALKYVQAFNVTIVNRSAMQYASQKYLCSESVLMFFTTYSCCWTKPLCTKIYAIIWTGLALYSVILFAGNRFSMCEVILLKCSFSLFLCIGSFSVGE